MEVKIALNGVKAGVVAKALGEKFVVAKVKYLPRPYLGYFVGFDADALTVGNVIDRVEKLLFVGCNGRLVIPDEALDDAHRARTLAAVEDVLVSLGLDATAIQAAYAPAPERFTVEVEALEGQARENFLNLLDAKRTLICHALGADDIPVYEHDGVMSCPWFDLDCGQSCDHIFAGFVRSLVDYAKRSKRISPVEHPAPNEKYAFRCFLLRLGYIGKASAEGRRVLLSKLSGNSAWLHGAPGAENIEK